MFRRLLLTSTLVLGSVFIASPSVAEDAAAADGQVAPVVEEVPTPEPAPAVEDVDVPAPPPAVEPEPESASAPEPAPEPVLAPPVQQRRAEPAAPTAAAAPAKAGPPLKVYVCKYVRTPGAGEVAQTVIDVSTATLKDFTGTFPHPFIDAQGSSIAIGYSTGPDAIDEPTTADCPTTPVDEPPVDEPPVDEPPVDEPPVDEPPAKLKVYVCKYVTTPGEGEILQSIIDVSTATLKDFTGTFPHPFIDAQGSSIAIGYSTGPDAIDEPTTADCPTTPVDEPPVDEPPVDEPPVDEPPVIDTPEVQGVGEEVTAVDILDAAATVVPEVQVAGRAVSTGTLPSTGASGPPWAAALGLLMSLAGAAVLVAGRRRV